MSDVHLRPGAADRNLLFAMLALQMNFVGKDRLVAAMQAWMLDRTRSVGDVLVQQGELSPERFRLLDALVEEHVKASDHDTPQRRVPLADAEATILHVGLSEERHAGTRYHILRPYARGGLGELFVAEDLELHREVALKEIQPRYADDSESRHRFLLEAEVTARLEHPGVVPVHGLGAHADGRPYYAMRLVHGETLGDAIRRFHEADAGGRPEGERRLALRQLLSRLIAVCNTVAYAHSRGVIHRDLKPANVMLGKFGETVVLDWGLAKVVGRAESALPSEEATLHPTVGAVEATRAGATVGTAAFMSPEQAAGEVERQGPASDVYSLGATLYTLLTGRPPFEGDNLATIVARVRQGDWLPPRRVKPDVPAPLDAICRKAMALQPENRYGTALELGAELERWLADEPVTAWQEPLWVRLGRWARRQPVLSVWVGFSAAFYLACVAAWIIGSLYTVRSRPTALLLPSIMVLFMVVAMSAGSQVVAVLGAGIGWAAGLLTREKYRRRQRAARWASMGSKVGLPAGALLGYLGIWGLFWNDAPLSELGSFRLLVGVVILGPLVGTVLGWVVGIVRSTRVHGAIVGGLVGACLATAIGFMLVLVSTEARFADEDEETRSDYIILGRTLLRLERHAEASQAAEELVEKFSQNPESHYTAARFLARCVPLAQNDTHLAEAQRRKAADAYGARAVQLLRQAWENGYRRLDQFKNADLDPIRERPDYQALLAEWQASQ